MKPYFIKKFILNKRNY